VWVYVARDKGGKILGTATIAIFETPYESRAIIEDVVVDKDYRGQGIATALMNKLLITAKKEGVKRVKLNSHPHRLAANAMYQSLGYELLSTNTYQICI
jgi:GNAT superfamily N-acetyltransferase